VELEDFPYPSRSVFSVQAFLSYVLPTISVKPSHNGPFYTGTVLNLTCDFELDPAIDVPAVNRIRWFVGGQVFDQENPKTRDRVTLTERSISFFPVDVVDNTTYRCRVTLHNGFTRESPEFNLRVEGKGVIC
jgi:hypothetical protein